MPDWLGWLVLARSARRRRAGYPEVCCRADGPRRNCGRLTAEGQRQPQVLVSEGHAKAIDIVFTAIHEGRPDADLLAYQYLQVMPKIAEGQASQLWMIPSELTKALDGFASAFGSPTTKTVPAVAEPNAAPPAHRTSDSNRRPATD